MLRWERPIYALAYRTIGREDERVANMWSSTQDSVLTGPPRAGAPLPPRYVINATIDDGANGRRLWQGHVSYTGVELREAETLAAMVPFLLDTLDKNVREQGFRLP